MIVAGLCFVAGFATAIFGVVALTIASAGDEQ